MSTSREVKKDRGRMSALKRKYPDWIKAYKPRQYRHLVGLGYVEVRNRNEFRITKEGLASFRYNEWSREDDQNLLQLVGKKSTQEIADILGRTESAVRYAMRRLEVNNYRYGEAHWNAKVDDLLVSMILTLHDAGYQPAEIESLVNTPRDVNRKYIYEVSLCRVRSNPAQPVAG